MGCCPSHVSEDPIDGEREHFISQNDTEHHDSAKCDGQEETIAQLKSTISELEDRVAELNTEKQTLLTRYTGVQGKEIEQLKSEISGFKEQIEELKTQNQSLTTRKCDGQEETIAQLKSTISELENRFAELNTEKQTLLTRYSQLCCVKFTDGNPKITDLSDPNRPDKLAEQFSELYDNQWTESFQVLCETVGLSDENAIQVLLKIILTVYHLCREQMEYQNKKLEKALSLFTGLEVMDQANESVILESLQNLQSFRAKRYEVAKESLTRKIRNSLQSSVGSEAYNACQEYIAESIKVCWLMCVKLPSMYISAATEETFNQDLYTSYTQSGAKVSYVVWPTLFQYENGPKLKKGVAQGTN